MYINAEHVVFVPSEGSSSDGNMWSPDQSGQNLLKGKHHMCTVCICPPLQGAAEVGKEILFLNGT